MNHRCVAAVVMLALSGAALGQAFTSESAFLAAVVNARTLTFDAGLHGLPIPAGPCVDFAGTARYWDAVCCGGGGTAHTRPNVAFNFGTAPIEVRFLTPVGGIGFWNTSVFDRERVRLYDAANTLLFEGQLPEGAINFLGFVSATPIARAEVVGIAPTNGTIFIDTLSYGSSACYPDCEGDCALDIFDFLCFQNLFDAGDPYACECDILSGSGVCDIFDFLCFQNAFAAGCP